MFRRRGRAEGPDSDIVRVGPSTPPTIALDHHLLAYRAYTAGNKVEAVEQFEWLFSTPVVRSVARPVSRLFGHWIFRRMYWWQVGSFIRDADVRREFVPLLYQQFDATPSAQPAFFRLNEDLLPMVRSHTEKIPRLREFKRPVRIIFGDADYTLN